MRFRLPWTRRPRVTVVIPTFNWATVLPYSIASVLGQSMDDLELLVIGDGCTDESGDVVRAVADPRVRWVNLPVNGGTQAGPNNEGLRQARGEYTAYLGHDDLWLPDHLHHLVAAAGKYDSLVYGLQLRVAPERAPFIAPEPGWSYRPGRWIPPTSFLHRTDHARSAGGWRPPAETGTLNPESDLVARIAARFGDPQRVEHVTSIKFPASLRRDVYRLRPCHEQERWSRRIREAADPEQMAHLATGDPIDESLGALPDERRGAPPKLAVDRQALNRRVKGLDP